MTNQPGTSDKIFGLGLARTGTTSLHHAMGLLGIASAPSSAQLIDGLDRRFLDRYDAFFDNPVPFLRPELERLYPEARFIVTWRPLETWLPSMRWLFGPGLDRLSPPVRRLGDRVHREVYGIDHFDPELLTAIHRRHYQDLRTWSDGRDDVLWLDQSQGLGWGPLCRFLGLDEPAEPFPVSNRSGPAGPGLTAARGRFGSGLARRLAAGLRRPTGRR